MGPHDPAISPHGAAPFPPPCPSPSLSPPLPSPPLPLFPLPLSSPPSPPSSYQEVLGERRQRRRQRPQHHRHNRPLHLFPWKTHKCRNSVPREQPTCAHVRWRDQIAPPACPHIALALVALPPSLERLFRGGRGRGEDACVAVRVERALVRVDFLDDRISLADLRGKPRYVG